MRIVIAGAGIGGLSAALSLHAAGFKTVQILEAARDVRAIGVGINLPPHAVRELAELGLGGPLARIGIETEQLCYYDRNGQQIWAEQRGRGAGYHWPQYSVHRGRLQHLLLHAVTARLGKDAIHMGQRVLGMRQGNSSVAVTARDAATDTNHKIDADVLVGADGIRSTVRDAVVGKQIPLATNGWAMTRGVSHWSPFLGGRSMVIAGDEQQRVVVYPLGQDLINWLVVQPLTTQPDAIPKTDVQSLGNWNLPTHPTEIAKQLASWRFDWLDIPALVHAAESAYVYPMADIDPLPQWTFGCATLLGDAAHAMYPFGSNGASQAILDARVLAHALAKHDQVQAGLLAYEAVRREEVARVQLANRRQAGDVMARIGTLSRAGAHGQAKAELQAVEQEYKRLAGFDVDTLNTRPSWSVPRKHI